LLWPRTLSSRYQTLHQAPALRSNKNLSHRLHYPVFSGQNLAAFEYFCGLEYLLWTSTNLDKGRVYRTQSDWLVKLCLLHGDKLLSAGYSCRGQPEGSQCQWLSRQCDIFPVPSKYFRAAELTLPETTSHSHETDSC